MDALLSGLLLVPWHMGALHPFEKVLTLLLAFGPFLILGGVIAWRRRIDAREEAAEAAAAQQGREDDRPGL